MNDHIYKQIKLTGSSTDSIEDAVTKALAKAAKTVHHMRWFEVVDTRGTIDNGQISHWQVTIEIGFTLDE